MNSNSRANLDSSRSLNRVEARAGGYVEVEIGVVHPMQPPKRGHRVKPPRPAVPGQSHFENGNMGGAGPVAIVNEAVRS
jgi:hypothetical protein